MSNYWKQFAYPTRDASYDFFDRHQIENALRRQRRQRQENKLLQEIKIDWRKEGF